ncbi:HNH endonuclease signature motif containing protein [Micromonospora tulbaghiae]|uniref:HNH endonuclease n=1 Tax=Micromonospora tulbaghiae TaxID=479978 RepID=UPI0033B657F5
MHYQRWRQKGDVGEAAPSRQRHAGEVCAVDGCGQPRRKRDWCGSHYVQWNKTGEVVPFAHQWSRAETCCVCGKPTGAVPGLKKYCSWACKTNWCNYNGEVPASVDCVHCGKPINLATSGKGGKRRRSDVKQCRRCRNDMRKHGMSVEQLAQRDGTSCGLCGSPVDMSLRKPNLMCPSVDHILPRARGGTNDPANLQLAHLLCNTTKRDRIAEAA